MYVLLMQAEFCTAKGYKTDCEVVYGDTDSVMVNFKVSSGVCNQQSART